MSIEKLLESSRSPKPRRVLDSDFTQKVMQQLGEEPRKRREWWARFLHIQRLLLLPKAALVALSIGAVVATSGFAYAAIQWLVPRITITNITQQNDNNKREFAVNVEDCGVMVGGETAQNGAQRFEVAPEANLSDEQVMKVLKASCDYQQILQLSNTRWNDAPRIGERPGDSVVLVTSGAGGYNIVNDPSIGKITAIDSQHITIASTVYKTYNGPNVILPGDPIPDFEALTEYYPDGKVLTRTLDLAADVDALFNGQSLPLDQLKVDDTVFFMSEVTRTVVADKQWSEPTSVKVKHLLKTDIDPAYVQPLSVGNPAIVNAIARLDACHGNNAYTCVAPKNAALQFMSVYSYTSNMEKPLPEERFKNNESYLRTDIDLSSSSGEFFHTIEGRITSLGEKELAVHSRGKADQFKIVLPYDVAAQFRQTEKRELKIGDYIQVHYLQKPGEDVKNIKTGDIMGISLLLRQLPDGSFAAY